MAKQPEDKQEAKETNEKPIPKKGSEPKPEHGGSPTPSDAADGELKEVASAAAEATGEEPNALLGVLKKISSSPAGDAIIDLVMKGAESSGGGGAPMPAPKPGGMPMPGGGGEGAPMPMPKGGGGMPPMPSGGEAEGGKGGPDLSKLLASMGGGGGQGGGMPAPQGGENQEKQVPPNIAKLMGGLKR